MISGTKKHRGVSLVEVVIASAILALFGAAVSQFMSALLKTADDGAKLAQAALDIEEAVESVRFLRDRGWTSHIESLTLGQQYYLEYGAGVVSATTTQISEGGMTTYFKMFSAYRDANNDLGSAGVLDPDTRKVVAGVSWQKRGATTTKEADFFIFNTFND